MYFVRTTYMRWPCKRQKSCCNCAQQSAGAERQTIPGGDMTFDETLYGRSSDDGDEFGENEAFDDIIDDEEEEELEDEEEEAEEQELGHAEDETIAPSASRAQRDEEEPPAKPAPAPKKVAKKAAKKPAAKKAAAKKPATKVVAK